MYGDGHLEGAQSSRQVIAPPSDVFNIFDVFNIDGVSVPVFPQQLAGAETQDESVSTLSDRPKGLQILVQVDSRDELRKTTIGGLLRVQDKN